MATKRHMPEPELSGEFLFEFGRPKQDQSERRMPYGKFKGLPLSKIGRGYLAEVYDKHENLGEPFRRDILRVLSKKGLCFGKFKNVPLADVPTHYLRWLLSTEDSQMFPMMRKLIKRELRKRGAR
jgi:uncharacterized protein (DUF3820 family)